MITGLDTAGAEERLVRALIEMAIEHNARWYAAHRSERRVDALGVRYVPDPPSDKIIIVGADRLRPGMRVSCGTAAAAWAGYGRSRGDVTSVHLSMRSPGIWHAVASAKRYDGSLIWDPAKELK